MFLNETERIKRLIEEGAGKGLTELQFFALEIHEWKNSQQRLNQIIGERYYVGKHDILDRKRTVIGEDGHMQIVENLPNNKIVDNQYAKAVDQKVNYLLGKPITVNCKNKAYASLLNRTLDRSFQRLLKYVGEDSVNGGIGWLFVYYNNAGELCFRRFPPYEILPFWRDDDHTVLDCAARLYLQQVWDGYAKRVAEKVEIFKDDGIHRYILDGNTLVPDIELGDHDPYFKVEDERGGLIAYNWDSIPLIAFKFNKQEIPLINRVKTLQDGINTMLSDFENNMQEDARNTILVLENYDGENLGEFRRNLATYGAVKVRTGDGAKGGVSTLTVDVNSENYKSILELFKKALIENARGYDAKDDRLSGNPNQMNIQSMYSDIDLDANGMETEFQAAFEELLWFINHHLINTGKGDFTNEDITIVFNRDILINESESIDNCGKSVGILSAETIVEQHPWTTDIEMELSRLEAEKQAAADEYHNAFGAVPNREPKNEE